MYRMSSDLAPYATHPDMPQFHNQIVESARDLQDLGRKTKQLGLRLSFHPSQFIILNSPDPELTRKSIRDLASQAEILDAMELDPEAVMVIHVGGVYGDRIQSRARWAKTWPTLPEPVRRRLVLENDDLRFSAADVLWINELTGVRLAFDYQHFWCFNPERVDMVGTLRRFLASWPSEQRAKIHFSSPRTELRQVERTDSRTRKKSTTLLPPIFTAHADFCNPFEFIRFMRDAAGLEFDVMLEAKAKDLALLRLRADLLRYAPEAEARFGIVPDNSGLSDGERITSEQLDQVSGEIGPDEGADFPDQLRWADEVALDHPPVGT
jgi:UV DNA damage endonuclease